MSDVKIICILNDFSTNIMTYRADFSTDEKSETRISPIDLIAFTLQEEAKKYNVNDILFVGANTEYMRGIRELTLNDLALNYDNTSLNIKIIGEE